MSVHACRLRFVAATRPTFLAPFLGAAFIFSCALRSQTVLTWSSGDILNSTTGLGATLSVPTISNLHTVNLTTTGSHTFDGRTVVNDGTINWSGGNFVAGNSGTLTNNATFNDTSTGTFANSGVGGTTMTFNNTAGAVYNKQSAGTKDTGVVFTNAGTVNVDTGTLRFNAGGSSTGTIDADAGTTVQFTNSYSVPDLSKLIGAGIYELTGGTLSAGGSLNVATFNQSGGTLAGTLTVASGNTWFQNTALFLDNPNGADRSNRGFALVPRIGGERSKVVISS